MDRRYINQAVARNVSSAITSAKCDNESVARAADITVSELDSRLNMGEGFSVSELVMSAAFLRLRPTTFTEGISA